MKLEKKFIALFSHCNQCKIHCKTSSEWLGSFAYDPKVRCSGLWNDHHVCSKDEFTEDGLNRLLELAKATPNSDQKRLNDLEKELQKHKDCSEHTEN